jgi:hypothetical protein
MNDETFEKQLHRQPFRELPPQWRAEILAAAGASCRLDVSRSNQEQERDHEQEVAGATSRPEVLRRTERADSWWRSLLWPSPVAWAGVAAAWVLVLGLEHFTFRPDPSLLMAGGAPVVLDFRVTLAMQRQLEAELRAPPEATEPEHPEPNPRLRPQSSRRMPVTWQRV